MRVCNSWSWCLKWVVDLRIGLVEGVVMKFSIVFSVRVNNWIVR